MNTEVRMSVRFVAHGWARNHAWRGADQSCKPSPIPFFIGAFALTRRCVQNHSTIATATKAMRIPRWPDALMIGGAGRRGGEHFFQLLADRGHERIAIGAARVLWGDVDGLTDCDHGAHGSVDTRNVGEVLLESLHCFEQSLRSGMGRKIAGRVERELLREIDVGQLAPGTVEFGFGQGAGRHTGEHGDPEEFDPLHNVLFPPALEPLGCERHEQAVDEAVQPVLKLARLRCAEILNLFQCEECVAKFSRCAPRRRGVRARATTAAARCRVAPE